MVDCASLENWRAARSRGFESHPLRHLKPLQLKGYSAKPNETGKPSKCAKVRQNARIMRVNWLPFGYPSFQEVGAMKIK